MPSDLDHFERVARRVFKFSDATSQRSTSEHPFDARDLHSDLPPDVKTLFDNGHYAQSTFEAFKFIDEEVQRISGDSDFGSSLMMRVFGGDTPSISINGGKTKSEKSEQEGFKFLFAGAMLGIRNPRGHTSGINDDPDACLDHLALASMLLRRLEDAGLR